jgi:hypothetical protein
MANRPDALQSSRRSQCSSESVRTTWLYHPAAIQCLTSIRVSASRHSYGKTAATVWTTWLYRSDAIQCLTSIRVSTSRNSYGKTAATVWMMCDPIRTMFSIRQVVHTKFNCPDVSVHGLNDQASYMEIVCTSSTIWTSAFRFRTLKALLW